MNSDANTFSVTVPPEDGAAIRQGRERWQEDSPNRRGPAEHGAGRHGDVKPRIRTENVICGR